MSNHLKVCVFVGPTLPESEVQSILPQAMVLGPAQQGDIDFARRQLGAHIVGMIDGEHTMTLPVWHKEVLSVMEHGARFLGAASLGALRAVECEAYGSEPIGEIADMYRSGELESDDEVCLTHTGREQGYQQLSVPLVNIRATLKACGASVNSLLKQEIIEYARQLYYPDRNWQAIFEGCELAPEVIQTILDCELDLKAADALHLCYYIADINGHPRPLPDRKIKHANKGFGKVFNYNDRKLMTDKGITRLHNIAQTVHPYDIMNARNRALALELCDMLGIEPRQPVREEDCKEAPDDLTMKDYIEICNQQRKLDRAGEWLSANTWGFREAPIINDFLRISGRYQHHKEGQPNR
jgi:hypothetical protein